MSRTVTIGEVLNQLRDEFPDVTSSQIRYYENKGLIAPDRSEGGYRRFTAADIDRVRYVLRAQRDRYLPLDVIREELERIDAGQVVALPPPSVGPPVATAAPGAEAATDGVPRPPAPGEHHAEAARGLLDEGASDVRLGIEGLSGGSGLNARTLTELRAMGLIGDGPQYDGTDLRIARAAADLLERGGLEPRHLKLYVRFADNEVAQHQARVQTHLRRGDDNLAEAREDLEHTAAAALELHRALLLRGLTNLLR